MIRFLCPTCSAKVQAPDEKAAQSGRCPQCGGAFIVPQAPTFALEISPLLLAPPIESSAPIPAAPPLPDEHIEAPLVEAPTRADMVHSRTSAPTIRRIDDDLPEESTVPAKPRGFHPLTIATGAALLLVIVITTWKLTPGPATTEQGDLLGRIRRFFGLRR